MRLTILYISSALLHPCDMKLPNFMRSLYGVSEHNAKALGLFPFILYNNYYGPFGFDPGKFRQHLPN